MATTPLKASGNGKKWRLKGFPFRPHLFALSDGLSLNHVDINH